MDQRLRALCDLAVPEVRESIGLHEYDGRVQDLSPDGVASGLARLGAPSASGTTGADPYDEAVLQTHERFARVLWGELAEHRRSPLPHLGNLDLSGYDRDYAPAAQRADARRRHLAAWPEAVDAAVASLDRVPAPVAAGLLRSVEGLITDLDPAQGPETEAALAAHAHFALHVKKAAEEGDPDPALGAEALSMLLDSGEATTTDLGRLEELADAERDRLLAMLRDACRRIDPGQPMRQVVASLLADHPDADGVLAEARSEVAEAIAFTREHDLLPELGGQCLVGPAPASRRWATAMLSWAAPYEEDGPSWYWITPPEPSWPAATQAEWLEAFSRTTSPSITVHECAPGHFAHGRLLRRVKGDVRRTLHSGAFIEGWAHYCEELCLEEGFRDGDPRLAAGVAIEALTRVTRLAVSLGVHRHTMSMEDAVRRFERDAFTHGPAARSEAARSTFDPTYGRYTWGKLEILARRDEARARWGSGYSHRRFHEAMLALGSPPLGLLHVALEERPGNVLGPER